MGSNDKYTSEKIIDVHGWTPHLFSFRTTRDPDYRFTAGQFARLGVRKGEEIVWRPYSVVSAEQDDFLEFYSIVVPGGEFTSRLSHMKAGDEICVERQSYGFMTLDRFVDGRDLWLLATGTGLGPYISILHREATWKTFENIIVVHSVRHTNELTYQDVLRNIKTREPFAALPARFIYLQAVTRDTVAGAFKERITDLLRSGELERHVGLDIAPDHSRVMLCGNPQMVDESRQLLKERGIVVGRRATPGQLAIEAYW
jgi:ferredoxin--NADP+ reductase